MGKLYSDMFDKTAGATILPTYIETVTNLSIEITSVLIIGTSRHSI